MFFLHKNQLRFFFEQVINNYFKNHIRQISFMDLKYIYLFYK